MAIKNGDLVEVVSQGEHNGKTGVAYVHQDGTIGALVDEGRTFVTLSETGGFRVVRPFRTEKEILELILAELKEQTEILAHHQAALDEIKYCVGKIP